MTDLAYECEELLDEYAGLEDHNQPRQAEIVFSRFCRKVQELKGWLDLGIGYAKCYDRQAVVALYEFYCRAIEQRHPDEKWMPKRWGPRKIT